jgi:hypothetical protein
MKDDEFKSKSVVVRSNLAGVFFGIFEGREGNAVTLSKARKLWKWSGAFTVAEIAKYGCSKPENCRFSTQVERQMVFDVCEIILATEQAKENLNAMPEDGEK